MIQAIDTSSQIYSAYSDGVFDLARWENYMDREVPGAKELCLADMRETVSPEYSWEARFLPVLNRVPSERDEAEKTACLFHEITDHLDKKIKARFGRTIDADVILYLGLCNGAGWVTEIKGRTCILLGVEKILELGWNNRNDMNGLILHELGHAYQEKYGVLYRDFADPADQSLWQLFTEGIAMVFEQEIVGDSGYFHQNRGGWKDWCGEHLRSIASDFDADCSSMTRTTQRYFGDWAVYRDHTDVGYYLGTRFVRSILEKEKFDVLTGYDIDDVRNKFREFTDSLAEGDTGC